MAAAADMNGAVTDRASREPRQQILRAAENATAGKPPLHPSGAADSSYLGWQFLNNTQVAPAIGLTTATITFTAPQAAGTYNVRLYGSGGYAKLATSVAITVQ
ncbi:MAG: hypothetical protein ACKOEC_20710 [Acidimicrobiia bacterium]